MSDSGRRRSDRSGQECSRETYVSGSRAVVVAQQPAEPLATNDLTCACVLIRKVGGDESPIDALMTTFRMIVGQVLLQHAAYLTLVEQDQVVECLGLQREHPAFGIGVQVG